MPYDWMARGLCHTYPFATATNIQRNSHCWPHQQLTKLCFDLTNSHRSVRLSSPHVIPHPQCPTCSGPGGRRPPGQRRPRAARRTVGDPPLEAGVLASPGRRPFLPGPLSPPLSYIPQPCNGPNGPKGLHFNKPKTKHAPILAVVFHQWARLGLGLGFQRIRIFHIQRFFLHNRQCESLLSTNGCKKHAAFIYVPNN